MTNASNRIGRPTTRNDGWHTTVKGLRWDLVRDGQNVGRIIKEEGETYPYMPSFVKDDGERASEYDEGRLGVSLWEERRLKDAKRQIEDALTKLAK